MALAPIAIPPSSNNEFFLWANAHATHHYDCIRVAGLQFGRQLTEYVLDPFDPELMDEWLNNHQQMHLEMDALLGIAPYELSELDWEDPSSVQSWFAKNYAEHAQWGARLNLG